MRCRNGPALGSKIGTRLGGSDAPIVPCADQKAAKFGRAITVSSLTSLIPGVRTLRYVLVAVVAFSVGGATVVQAVAPSGILGTIRISDGANDTRLATVDAAGSLQVKVTNPATTQTVSGHVDVDNFPSTQDVNVTGGTVNTRPAIATRTLRKFIVVEAGESDTTTFTTLNASFIQVRGDATFVRVIGPLGEAVQFDDGDRHIEATYPQRVPINTIFTVCSNVVLDCRALVNIVGD